ncbi:MAG: hypothetical protein WD875_19320 [Pirellulales bacterium]
MHSATPSCFVHLTDLALGDLVDIVGGTLRLSAMPPRDGDMTPIERIVTDPCHVQRGDVYWAMPSDMNSVCSTEQCTGKHVDAACEALMRGASGVVSNHRVEPFAGRWAIEVADPLVALWELARWRRDRFCGSVIAVCGDDRDTATAMIDCVLGSRLAGTAPITSRASRAASNSASNVDDRVATPLSLLAIDATDDYALVQISADSAARAEATALLCRPRIAVVASADESAGAARQTLSHLSTAGFAVLCGDDAAVRRMASATAATVRTFGRRRDCDVSAANVEYRDGHLRFDVDGVTIRTRVWGRHHLHAALAAYAVGRILEFSPHEIAAALAAFVPPPGRCDVTQADGLTIINDPPPPSKNSLVGLELLRETAARGRRFVICGEENADAHENVASSPQNRTHRNFGEYVVSRAGADRLVAFGREAGEIVHRAREAGMPLAHAVACPTLNDAANYVEQESQAGDVLLFQGARSEAIDKIFNRHSEQQHAPTRRAA